MEKRLKKKRKSWQQYVGLVFFMGLGAMCGVFIAEFMDSNSVRDISQGERLLYLGALLIGMYIIIFLHLIIHEAGHLVFGLMTGYQFNSFRIFNFMWILENNELKLKRLTLAGTGGQCLMTPPPLVDGKIPIVLYNLGGSLMNILASCIAFGLYLMVQETSFFSILMLMVTAIGFILAMMNAIPMRLGLIDNDGYNALTLRRSSEAMRAFWIQLKVNEQLTKGIRLHEMPEEWFFTPKDEAMTNSMVATMGVFNCNRMLDSRDFEKAYACMEHMLEIESGMVGIHRSLIICDCIYCELIAKNRRDVLEKLLDSKQKKFMKAMKKFPSVLRSEYAYALLAESNVEKAEAIKKQFEKCAKTYPYPSEIQAERELMAIAMIKLNQNFFDMN